MNNRQQAAQATKRVAIVVTGSRYAQADVWEETIQTVLDGAAQLSTTCVLIHGDASGIDTIADAVGERMGLAVIPIPALWESYGNGAGPLRNTEMLTMLERLRKYGYETRVLAFHDDVGESRGTKNCVKQALGRNFEVHLFSSDGHMVSL